MIRSMNMKLDVSQDSKFGISRSSLLHGFLMEKLDAGFADKMHAMSMRPYSQNLLRESDGNWIWQIKTISDDAWVNISRVFEECNSIFLRHCNAEIKILSKEITETDFSRMFEKAYFSDSASRFVEIEFVTPTAFKSNGAYINYPDVKMLLSSLIRKYDLCSEKTAVYDEKLMEEIIKNTSIVKYNLRSTHFHLEGVKIPSFVCKITLKTTGHSNMACMVNMLAEFGTYSGVGIKNALGMGALRIIEQRKVYANE